MTNITIRSIRYDRLLGNRRRNLPSRQDVLLTARRDAVKAREKLLRKDSRGALGDLDWLIDNLDNMLAEGC